MLRHESTAALAAGQQPPHHQLLNRFTQGGPRYTKLLRQGTFRRQAFSGLETALQNHRFQLLHDFIGKSPMTDLSRIHATSQIGITN